MLAKTQHSQSPFQSYSPQILDELLLKDSLLLQDQTDFLSDFSKKIYRNSTLCSDSLDQSFETMELGERMFQSFCSVDLSREGHQSYHQQNESFRESLHEIKLKCSRKTFSLISEKVLGCGHQARNEKKLKKQIRQNQELVRKIQMLQREKIQLQTKLKEAQLSLSEKQSQKGTGKEPKFDYARETKLIQLEKSIIFREKVNVDSKKMINAQLELLRQSKEQYWALKEELLDTVEEAMSNIGANSRSQELLLPLIQKISKGDSAQRQSAIVQQYQQEIQKTIKNLRRQTPAVSRWAQAQSP